jgi:hypothetical protein
MSKLHRRLDNEPAGTADIFGFETLPYMTLYLPPGTDLPP